MRGSDVRSLKEEQGTLEVVIPLTNLVVQVFSVW